MATSDRVVIKRLKLHSQGPYAGSGSGRAQTEWVRRTLQGAELQPLEMPPSAVLLIRRLEGPPARGPLGWGRAAAGRWEANVKGRIGQSYLQASRPVLGELPDDPDAAVFRDPAELTAALLLDVARGRASGRWWWQCAIEDPAALRELPRAFLREIRYIPAAVAYLISWGRAEEVARSLSPAEARTIAARLCAAFGLARLSPLFHPAGGIDAARRDFAVASYTGGGFESARPGNEEPDREALRGAGERGVGQVVSGTARLARREAGRGRKAAQTERPDSGRGETDPLGAPRPRAGHFHDELLDRSGDRRVYSGNPAKSPGAPWNVPSSTWFARAGRERAALFGIAELLARSPQEARTEGFASRFAAWWQDSHGPAQSSPGVAGRRFAGNAGATSMPKGTPTHPRPVDFARAEGNRAGAGWAAGSAAESSRITAAGHGEMGSPATGGDGGIGAMSDDHGAAVVDPETVRLAPPAPTWETPRYSEGPAPKDPALAHLWNGEPGCATRLGGVLYLLNAMKRLRLPDCFQADWRLGAALGRWGCLQALGIGLLTLPRNRTGPLPVKDIWSDPIWRLLAALEGRDASRPLGAGVAEPAQFSAPQAWMPLLGGERPGPPESASWRTLETACAIETECPFSIAPALRRWIGHVAPLIAAYLHAAARPVAASDFDPASLLFVEGMVYATKTHVDLVADLNQISLVARVAGLDADPGWDPLLARVVQFHFR